MRYGLALALAAPVIVDDEQVDLGAGALHVEVGRGGRVVIGKQPDPQKAEALQQHRLGLRVHRLAPEVRKATRFDQLQGVGEGLAPEVQGVVVGDAEHIEPGGSEDGEDGRRATERQRRDRRRTQR